MMPPLTLHADNRAIRVVTKADMSHLYIGLLWSHRRLPKARAALRAHVALLRRRTER